MLRDASIVALSSGTSRPRNLKGPCFQELESHQKRLEDSGSCGLRLQRRFKACPPCLLGQCLARRSGGLLLGLGIYGSGFPSEHRTVFLSRPLSEHRSGISQKHRGKPLFVLVRGTRSGTVVYLILNLAPSGVYDAKVLPNTIITLLKPLNQSLGSTP